ncbi:hypothetical protein KFE25_011982 [Diacronema lutheri]|uniref:Uncharacterized protein n=2 Tax=Diacronema lutheri TaxID=2081491 RepID=A0A8J5X0V6_DIALT|nr:hypothetical protein KFE25_011982 [Diacronema lutheri]
MAPVIQRRGVHFPLQPDGAVSTTKTGKAIWAAAARAAGAPELAAAIDAERDWRHAYKPHVLRLAEQMARSRERHLAGAHAGLAAFEAAFELVPSSSARAAVDDADAAPRALYAAVRERAATPSAALRAAAVRSERAPRAPAAALVGADPVEVVARWTAYGVCEPSALDALRRVASDGARDDGGGAAAPCVRSHVFVCLGGTAEMGPARTLLALGATVVAVARPGARLQALIRFARGDDDDDDDDGGGACAPAAGMLIVPVPAEDAADGRTDRAGCDMLDDPCEVAAWLAHLDSAHSADGALLAAARAAGGGRGAGGARDAARADDDGGDGVLVLGTYGYLDGADHVRLTAAMDAIVTAVVAVRAHGRTSAAYLPSPSTAAVVPREARDAAAARYEALGALSLRALRTPNARAPVPPDDGYDGGRGRCVCDGLATLQGPNYALAKTAQQWRAAMLSDGGRCARVSSLMAPGARTASMVHVATLSAALHGLEAFEPLHVPSVTVAAGVMALLLVADLLLPQSDFASVGHTRGAVHGGAWRCAFTAESIGWTAYALGALGYRARPLPPAPPAPPQA